MIKSLILMTKYSLLMKSF